MRRILIPVLAVALLAPAGLAVAQEATSDPAPPIPLSVLTAAVEREIALLTGDTLLPRGDEAALIRAHEVRIDLFVGAMRAAADRTLRADLSRRTVSALTGIPTTVTPTEAIGLLGEVADLDPLQRWRAERQADEWLAFSAAIERLRAIGDARGPERVCPVQHAVWFTNDWGDGRPGNRTHKGTDLMAPRGVPVQAIEDGVVIQANYHRQGGRQIWVRADSTGDVYYYAHLDYWEKWIWTGTRVDKGDVMGLLGSSGNADGPHLHFGWMPGSGRVDLDNMQNPYPLLNEICTNRVDPPGWFGEW